MRTVAERLQYAPGRCLKNNSGKRRTENCYYWSLKSFSLGLWFVSHGLSSLFLDVELSMSAEESRELTITILDCDVRDHCSCYDEIREQPVKQRLCTQTWQMICFKREVNLMRFASIVGSNLVSSSRPGDGQQVYIPRLS